MSEATTSGIRMLDEAEADRLDLEWNAFPFGFRPAFGAVLARQLRSSYVLFAVPDAQAGTTYVPAIIRRRPFFATLRFLHVPAGPDGMPLDAESEARCMAALLQFVRARGIADRISAPFNWCIFRSVPAGATGARFGSYVLDLEQTPEQLWAGLHSKHRNGVRNAAAQGVEVRQGPGELETFHGLYRSTMARSAMPAEPLAFFQALMAGHADSVMCAVVYHHDVPQGGLFVPYTRAGAFYVYGASAETVAPTGAINFLHHRTILDLQQRGARKYDFVGARLSDVSGTKLAGIQAFKARFGGRLEEGRLWKLDISPARCAVFDALLKSKSIVRGHKPGLDIIDQEILKESTVPLS